MTLEVYKVLLFAGYYKPSVGIEDAKSNFYNLRID